jgi:hypothetical protein
MGSRRLPIQRPGVLAQRLRLEGDIVVTRVARHYSLGRSMPIFDISPPYSENWTFFTTIRDDAAMLDRGIDTAGGANGRQSARLRRYWQVTGRNQAAAAAAGGYWANT